MTAAYFTPRTLSFLSDLAANNNREWFLSIDEDSAAWKRASRGAAFRRTFELSGDSLVRAPQGFSVDHPLIEDLRRKDFIAVVQLSEDDLMTDDLLDRFTALCRSAAPFQRWLCRATGVSY